jgi:hypothetical protein
MSKTVPNPSNADFHTFIAAFCAQPIRPAKGMSPSNYDNDLYLLAVPVVSDQHYPPNYCWFNCLEHCIEYGGTVVCGWGIWQRGPTHFVAQHHAVWQSPDGGVFDLTPNGSSNTVLFIPDSRVPFDFLQLRCPFNFERKGTGYEVWFASGGVTSPIFSIAVLQPTSSEALRIDRIRKLAIERNII